MKLALDGDGTRPGLDLDGVVSARPGGLGPGFDGHATATGQVRLGGTTAAVPWRATARLSADRDGARGGDVELRAGADLRALIAAGEGAAAYPAGPALPQAHLKLQGAVLDVDDLAVAPAGSDVAPPQGLDVVRRLVDGISDGARLVSSAAASRPRGLLRHRHPWRAGPCSARRRPWGSARSPAPP